MKTIAYKGKFYELEKSECCYGCSFYPDDCLSDERLIDFCTHQSIIYKRIVKESISLLD